MCVFRPDSQKIPHILGRVPPIHSHPRTNESHPTQGGRGRCERAYVRCSAGQEIEGGRGVPPGW